MSHKNLPFPLAQLLRRNSPEQLRVFFRSIEETFLAVFADAERICPAVRDDRPAVYDRGNNRRHRLDQGFRASAAKAKFSVQIKKNSSGTWSYPVVRIGSYSVTLAIGDRALTYGPLRLRCKGSYMREHVEANDVMNPQIRLDYEQKGTKRLISNGSIGAVIVAEPSMIRPGTPNYIGFYVPKEDLSGRYYTISLENLIHLLSRLIAASPQKKPATAGRKKPILRRDSKRKKDGDRS